MRGKYPAYGQRCRTCNRKNHFAKCCRQTIDQVKNEQDSYSDTTDGSDFYINSVEVTHADPEVVSEQPVEKQIDALDDNQPARNYWSVTLETAYQYISYKIDTSADVLPKHLYYSLSPRLKLKQFPIKLQEYNGS